jgi:3-hydroxy acid dehydrogenase / malonic semialdehyde reductase
MTDGENVKRALVTGATSGIGKAVSLALTDKGYAVIALGRNVETLEELGRVKNIQPLALDLCDSKARETVLASEPIDVLINNAGIMPPNVKFSDMDQADIDNTIEVNLSAALRVTRLVLPGMIERKTGHVFFTGSTAGQAPFPNMAVYGASKAAISSFAAALRCDLSGTGVRVTEIVAGRVETALYRDALDEDGRQKMYSTFDAIQPENVAEMLLSVLQMPAHVDVTRFDILPTAQYVGGGGFAGKE